MSLDHEPILKPEPCRAAVRGDERPTILISLDRSWYNRLGLPRLTYFRLIHRAKGWCLGIDYGSGPEPSHMAEMAEDFIAKSDGLLLSGGTDVDPALYGGSGQVSNINARRDRFELELIRWALRYEIPVLGICRGCQLLNVALGGSLRTIRDELHFHRIHRSLSPHAVRIDPKSYLHRILEIEHLRYIRSLHGQCVDRPGESVRIVAWADDGIPEAIELNQWAGTAWLIGVQWHPELMFFRQEEHRLIDTFVDAARRVRLLRN